MHISKQRTSSSFGKGIFLLIFLVVAFFIYNRVTTKGLPGNLANLVNTEFENYRNLQEFDEHVKDSLKKEFGGFWVYETADSLAPVQKVEHLELRDNGIIWQAFFWFICLPSGDTITFSQIRHAYLNPYARVPHSGGYACDVRVIRQAFIIGNDTCYGDSHIDELWHAEKFDDEFVLNRREYTAYGGDIENFFPEGTVDLVDKLLMKNCSRGASLPEYSKVLLQEKLSASPPIVYEEEGIRQWVSHYYQPAVLEELVLATSAMIPVPDSVQVDFRLSSEGKVIGAELKKSSIFINGKFEQMLLREIGSWVFPKSIQGSKSKRVSHTFYF